tara:strand:- start:303 stop:812 length:510 start_codon:yes stop_codon:yes gene_type:complete
VKKIFVKFLFFLFFSSYSFACSILQVPIGSTIDTARNTFDFLDIHNSEAYGKDVSVLYRSYAIDYCEGSSLENVDLEVIVYDSRIASINLFSDSEFKNEVYNFTKDYISNPGEEAKNEFWTGLKDLSVGGLNIYYSKTKLGEEIFEILEITNQEMINYPVDEKLIEVIG